MDLTALGDTGLPITRGARLLGVSLSEINHSETSHAETSHPETSHPETSHPETSHKVNRLEPSGDKPQTSKGVWQRRPARAPGTGLSVA